MKTQPRKGYFFAFFQVQMAIASLAFIPYTFPPLRTYLPRIILFFVLLIAASVSILDRKKFAPLLQIISALGMLACLAVVLTIPPLGRILFDALGAAPRLRPLFGRAAVICLPASPFNLAWLLDEMTYSGLGRGFLITLFRGNWQLVYYLHTGIGFAFWLVYLFFLSADEDRKSGEPHSTSLRDDIKGSSAPVRKEAVVDGRLKDLFVFFKQHLAERLTGLERQRKTVASSLLQTHVYFSLTVIFCGIFGWFTAMQMLDEDISFGFAFFIIMILWIVGLSFYWPFRISRDKKDYIRNFKKEIIEQLVSFVDKSLVYEPEKKIDLHRFLAGGIFRRAPTSYEGDDYVSGLVGGRPLAFSELQVQRRMGRNYITVFKGLYFVIDSGRSFAGDTYVLSGSVGGAFGRNPTAGFRGRNKNRGQRITTGNAEFDRFFTVYSTAPEEAREVLNPEFLENVTAYRARNPHRIHFAFVHGEVHIALSHRKPFFEPPVYRTIIDFDLIAHYFEDLHLAIQVAGLAV